VIEKEGGREGPMAGAGTNVSLSGRAGNNCQFILLTRLLANESQCVCWAHKQVVVYLSAAKM